MKKRRYFRWLLRKIRYDPNIDCDVGDLKLLFNTEFTYKCANDDNRASDGIELRYRFDKDYIHDDDWPCSVLEMMIALADRCDKNIMGEPGDPDNTAKWFWVMMNNLDMATTKEDLEIIVKKMLDRKYDRDGFGGLFPLKYPNEYQRNVEIWFQLCAYLDENYTA